MEGRVRYLIQLNSLLGYRRLPLARLSILAICDDVHLYVIFFVLLLTESSLKL